MSNTLKAVEDRRKDKEQALINFDEDGLVIINRPFEKYMSEYGGKWDMDTDKGGERIIGATAFIVNSIPKNDHPIIGYQNRNVND